MLLSGVFVTALLVFLVLKLLECKRKIRDRAIVNEKRYFALLAISGVRNGVANNIMSSSRAMRKVDEQLRSIGL